ncbi:hypothetical protein BDZ85DRAFT_83512 [Elsinoe ampelina]|uniref:Uncharacterized protein n=1 Tax=Elsinoe ampelina TaxID=302913 RepID=A0A6A6GG89_9PEZI|nr:hypothetical protein BDZ85DRAFT_83512 [Elsinoe ampelina]
MHFYDLPAEIREQILAYALVAPLPITIWTSRVHTCAVVDSQRSHRLSYVDHQTTAACVSAVAFGLVLVDRRVSVDAIRVFYGRNSLCFHGVEEYLPVISWLHCIGDRNRSYLQRIVLMPNLLPTAGKYKRTDGVIRPSTYPHLHRPDNPKLIDLPPTDRFKDDWDYHYIPQMESLLKLLKRNSGETKVSLNIHLPDYFEGEGLHQIMPEPAYKPPVFGPPPSRYYTIVHRWLLHQSKSFQQRGVMLAWEVRRYYYLDGDDDFDDEGAEAYGILCTTTEVLPNTEDGREDDLDLDELRLGGWEVRRQKRFVQTTTLRNPEDTLLVRRYTRLTLTRPECPDVILEVLPEINVEDDLRATKADQEVKCGTCDRCKERLTDLGLI